MKPMTFNLWLAKMEASVLTIHRDFAQWYKAKNPEAPGDYPLGSMCDPELYAKRWEEYLAERAAQEVE